MYKEVVVINEKEHKSKGVKSLNHFLYAKDLNSCMITLDEFYESCKSYPILFAKNDEGWFALALFGLEDKNIFVNEDGEWKKDCYIPAYVRRYPFIYVKNDNELLLGIDKTQLIKKTKTNKRYFFEKDGKQSDFVKEVVKYLDAFQLQSIATKNFIEKLEKLDILEPSTIKKTNKDKEEIIGGFWVVSEDKLNNLKDEKKNLLCKDNSLKLITAHLISLSNIKHIY